MYTLILYIHSYSLTYRNPDIPRIFLSISLSHWPEITLLVSFDITSIRFLYARQLYLFTIQTQQHYYEPCNGVFMVKNANDLWDTVIVKWSMDISYCPLSLGTIMNTRTLNFSCQQVLYKCTWYITSAHVPLSLSWLPWTHFKYRNNTVSLGLTKPRMFDPWSVDPKIWLMNSFRSFYVHKISSFWQMLLTLPLH